MAGRSTIFEDVSNVPWQAGVGLAVLCHPIAVFPNSSFASGTVLVGLGIAVSIIWLVSSLLLLLVAFASFANQQEHMSIFKSPRSTDKIRILNWHQFEQFFGCYYRDQGRMVVEIPTGRDGGVDLGLHRDGAKTYVQCTKWKTHKVGVEKIHAILCLMAAGSAGFGLCQ